MDQEEIRKLVEGLNLSTEVTTNVLEIPNNKKGGKAWNEKLSKFVVGKIFVARIVNRETLLNHIPRILQLQTETDIEIVGDNIFVMVLGTERERRHVLNDGPWHFFESLMLFKEPQGMETPMEIQFNEFTTWVQCHNLPIACMNPEAVRRIGESIGRVEEVDEGKGGNCIGQYARVRIIRNINEPLQRCVRLRTEDGQQPHTILIRYERLPEFCQACGRVGHISRHCDDPRADKSKQEFGQWLRAARAMDYRRTRQNQRNRTEQSETSKTPSMDNQAMIRRSRSSSLETEEMAKHRSEIAKRNQGVNLIDKVPEKPGETTNQDERSKREIVSSTTKVDRTQAPEGEKEKS